MISQDIFGRVQGFDYSACPPRSEYYTQQNFHTTDAVASHMQRQPCGQNSSYTSPVSSVCSPFSGGNPSPQLSMGASIPYPYTTYQPMTGSEGLSQSYKNATSPQVPATNYTPCGVEPSYLNNFASSPTLTQASSVSNDIVKQEVGSRPSSGNSTTSSNLSGTKNSCQNKSSCETSPSQCAKQEQPAVESRASASALSKAPTIRTATAEQKDERYIQRRIRNNLAAKRSRDNRKRREDSMALRANYLEKANMILQAQVFALKREVCLLRGIPFDPNYQINLSDPNLVTSSTDVSNPFFNPEFLAHNVPLIPPMNEHAFMNSYALPGLPPARDAHQPRN